MSNNKEFLGLVKGKKNSEIYEVLEDDMYKNLSRGRLGRLKVEDAKKLFVIPVTLNLFAQKNPLILKLIENLNLSIDSSVD